MEEVQALKQHSVGVAFRMCMTTRLTCAEVDIANRAEAVRLAVHLLAGGDPDEMPDKWRSPGFVFPPGPASEFGHCTQGITNATLAGGELTEALRCHQFLGKEGNAGLMLITTQDKKGAKKQSLKVPEWFDVMLAGAPCLSIMLARAPGIIQSQVRSDSGKPPCWWVYEGQ